MVCANLREDGNEIESFPSPHDPKAVLNEHDDLVNGVDANQGSPVAIC